MKTERMICPSCNAPFEVNTEGKEYIFCNYCGSKIFLNKDENSATLNLNENINKTYAFRNETRITKMQIDQEERRAVREREDKRREAAAARKENHPYEGFKIARKVITLVITVAIIVLAIVFSSINIVRNRRAEAAISANEQGLVYVQNAEEDYLDRDYETVKAEFEAKGFKNIKLVEEKRSLFQKKGIVTSVSIDGEKDFQYKTFSPDAAVVISHH